MSVFVVPVPCLRDNYAYLVGHGDECVVVDPGEKEPVQLELEKRGLELVGIWSTHHHADHVGGNLALLDEWDVPVWAHSSEAKRVPGFTNGVEHGDSFEILGDVWHVLHNPGHTRGAISFYSEEWAFTGDTLFCAGCGRLFEGSAAEMHASFEKMRSAFAPTTRVCTGHEYTEANLRFSAGLLPNDAAIAERLERVSAERARGECCAVAEFSEELRTNLFLRASEAEVARAVGLDAGASAIEVFGALRAKKDRA